MSTPFQLIEIEITNNPTHSIATSAQLTALYAEGWTIEHTWIREREYDDNTTTRTWLELLLAPPIDGRIGMSKAEAEALQATLEGFRDERAAMFEGLREERTAHLLKASELLAEIHNTREATIAQVVAERQAGTEAVARALEHLAGTEEVLGRLQRALYFSGIGAMVAAVIVGLVIGVAFTVAT